MFQYDKYSVQAKINLLIAQGKNPRLDGDREVKNYFEEQNYISQKNEHDNLAEFNNNRIANKLKSLVQKTKRGDALTSAELQWIQLVENYHSNPVLSLQQKVLSSMP